MKAKEIREMTDEEINQRIADEKREVQNLRFQNAVAGLENPAILQQKRKEIARMRTILKERDIESTKTQA